MIIFGGFVRLTDSGLSIVEWKPVTGVIPPIGESAWAEEFGKYQTSPEYKQHNYDMSLSQFKHIFWLEYIHRLAGRVLGFLYLLPLMYFYLRGKIINNDRIYYLGIIVLLFFQGFMGWYMVKSGLVEQPHVSHFRLASHLITAVVIYSLLFWQLMKSHFDILLTSDRINLRPAKILAILTMALLFVQIIIGGLVAGLDAGLVYNTFPMMGDRFVPSEISSHTISVASLNEPVFVQFIHRIIAYLVSFMTVGLVVLLYCTNYFKLKKVACYMALALLAQMFAGICTVLFSVPIVLALIHQLGAIILLSILLWSIFLICS